MPKPNEAQNQPERRNPDSERPRQHEFFAVISSAADTCYYCGQPAAVHATPLEPPSEPPAPQNFIDRLGIIEQLLRVEPANANYAIVALDERVRRVVNRLINAETPAPPSRDEQEAARQLAFQIAEAVGFDVDVQVDASGTTISKIIATALTASRAEMVEKIKAKRDEWRAAEEEMFSAYYAGKADAGDELLTELEGAAVPEEKP